MLKIEADHEDQPGGSLIPEREREAGETVQEERPNMWCGERRKQNTQILAAPLIFHGSSEASSKDHLGNNPFDNINMKGQTVSILVKETLGRSGIYNLNPMIVIRVQAESSSCTKGNGWSLGSISVSKDTKS